MRDPKQLRRKFSLALIVLLAVALTCGIVLISPIGRGARAGQQSLSALWSELQLKTRETVPLQGIDGKVKEAKTEIDAFYGDRLPPRFAAIPEELGRLATEYHVNLSSARYKTEETDVPGIRRVTVEAALSGPYGQEARFINALERDKMFFIINSISLDEGGQNRGVRLQVVMETYIRAEGAA